jgi:hypothetical protein
MELAGLGKLTMTPMVGGVTMYHRACSTADCDVRPSCALMPAVSANRSVVGFAQSVNDRV